MVEPKLFYRKFDELLKTIRQKKTSKNFICLILTELQSNFGEELHLGGLRVYEERSGEFVLVRPSSNQNGKNGKVKIPRDSAVIQRVVEHGSYIYDDTNFSIDPEISKQTQTFKVFITDRLGCFYFNTNISLLSILQNNIYFLAGLCTKVIKLRLITVPGCLFK